MLRTTYLLPDAHSLLKQRFGLLIFPQQLVSDPQAIERMRDLETFRPQCQLPEVQRSLKQCFRLFKLSTLEADACQPVERTNCLGMFLLSSPLPAAQSPLIQFCTAATMCC